MSTRIVVGLCFLLSLHVTTSAPADSSLTWGLQVAPEFSIPMGGSADYYPIGAGARLAVALGLPAFKLVTPFLDLGYLFLPVLAAEENGANLSLIRGGAGGILSVPFGKRFTADVSLAGGYYAGLLHASERSKGGSFYGAGTAGVSMFLSPRLSLEAAAGYGYFHEVYQGLIFTLGTTARLAGRGGGPIPHEGVLPLFPGKLPAKGFVRISDAKLERVFPVLFKYYDTHPLGRITLSNASDRELEDLEVRLEMQGYMDAPKLSARMERLKKGESTEVELFALFNEKVLEVTEGTKVIAQVNVDYKVADRNGIVTTSIGTSDVAYAVTIQSDNKIVVAGKNNSDLAIARYTATGALDSSFGTGGIVTTAIGTIETVARGVAIQEDGKIVVAGRAFDGTSNSFVVVRYTNAGALDTTFGAGGIVTTAIGTNSTAQGIAIQADGKIVAAGSASPGDGDFALARYTTAGLLDATFGSGGFVTTPVGEGGDTGWAVAIQTDGKIVVAGKTMAGDNEDFAVVRYLP